MGDRLSRIPPTSETLLRAIRSERNSIVLPPKLRGEVNFCREAHLTPDPAARSDAPASPLRLVTPIQGSLTGGGGGHFRPDPLVLIGAGCALFWLVVWAVVLG